MCSTARDWCGRPSDCRLNHAVPYKRLRGEFIKQSLLRSRNRLLNFRVQTARSGMTTPYNTASLLKPVRPPVSTALPQKPLSEGATYTTPHPQLLCPHDRSSYSVESGWDTSYPGEEERHRQSENAARSKHRQVGVSWNDRRFQLLNNGFGWQIGMAYPAAIPPPRRRFANMAPRSTATFSLEHSHQHVGTSSIGCRNGQRGEADYEAYAVETER